MRVVVVKLGGSVVTVKDKPFALRFELLDEYGKLLGRLVREWRVVLVLGGGSYGHEAVRVCRENGARLPEALHLVSHAMLELASQVADILAGHGVYTLVYPPHAFCKPRGLEPRCDWSLVSSAVESGAVPLVYGDIYPAPGGYGIVSGDELAIEAACSLGASLVVYATSVDGVILGGRVVEKLDRSTLKQVLSRVGGSEHPDVTGGMKRKLQAVLVNGCPGLRVYIVNGYKPENVEAVVRGEHRGTLVTL